MSFRHILNYAQQIIRAPIVYRSAVFFLTLAVLYGGSSYFDNRNAREAELNYYRRHPCFNELVEPFRRELEKSGNYRSRESKKVLKLLEETCIDVAKVDETFGRFPR